MTRQEAFDRAARHLLAQGKPSGKPCGYGAFKCLYSGSGCALRPFLTEEQAEKFDRDYGEVERIPLKLLPDDIAEDVKFFSLLQDAHDKPAMRDSDPAAWLPAWRDRMLGLAKRFNLSSAVFASDAGGSCQ